MFNQDGYVNEIISFSDIEVLLQMNAFKFMSGDGFFVKFFFGYEWDLNYFLVSGDT